MFCIYENRAIILGIKTGKPLETLAVFGLQSFRPHVLAIADKIDAVDFGIKIRKLKKMLCCNNFSHFDAWIFLIFIIGQNRCIHLNFCSGNELEDFKKDFDPSNIGILQYTPLAHAHKTIHRSQKC